MAKYYFQCVNCLQILDQQEFYYLCPDCETENREGMPPKGILWMRYENPKPISKNAKELLLELWPIETKKSLPPLKVGETSLYSYGKMNNKELGFELLIKDDSQNPSYSFKDRASALVSAYAKEKGISTIITASTGNAGSSLACICASQGQKAIILLPKKAPLAKLVQVEMYGAELLRIDGNYDQAFDKSIEMSHKNQWFNRNTAYNPLTIEGKKSVCFEIFEQLKGQAPDLVFVPVGDVVILSAVFKGFEDLLMAGFISDIPKIIAVQAERSANLVDNLNAEELDFPSASTMADSISVDIPRNFYMSKYYLNKYQGSHIKVSDAEIMEASSDMAKNYGLFAEPASAAAFAGFKKYHLQKKISHHKKVVVLHTGSGLKDIQSAQNYLSNG